jgi:nitrogen fixation NifU-like protein
MGIMASSWEKFEELIKEKMRTVYSDVVVELGMNPKNLGEVDNANGFARITGPCGDTISIWLKIEGDSIVGTGFTTDGCTTSIASASMATIMAQNSNIEEARKVSQQDILDALGGLPDESRHCALLAANTLKAAIRDYLEQKENRDTACK